MVTVNASQMATAARCPEGASSTVVTLFSAAQATGRFFAGFGTDKMKSLGLPRPGLTVMAASLMAFGHGLMSLSTPPTLYTGVTFGGFGFGMMWPLIVVLNRELFGPEVNVNGWGVYPLQLDYFPSAPVLLSTKARTI